MEAQKIRFFKKGGTLEDWNDLMQGGLMPSHLMWVDAKSHDSAITPTEFVFALLPIISAEVVQAFVLLQVLLAVPFIVTITGDQVTTDQIASAQIIPVLDSHAGLSLSCSMPIIAFILYQASFV